MEENLAVLIDFENIAAGTEKEGLGRFDVDALMDRLKDKGRILVARSYADWGRFARFKQELLSANITMMELTSHGMQDKNRADIAMVVDCLELAFTREFVHTFVIVSGDSDFTPLVLKMRELNKKVIGVGTRGSTSRLIINACDEFIFYDSVVKAKPKPEPRVERGAARKVTKEHARAFGFLVEVVLGIQREDPFPPLASVVKTAIVRRQPDFSEQDLGFSAFTRFLEAARDAGYVTLQRDQKSGGYRVDTVEDDGADEAPEVPAQPARAAQAESGEVPEDSYYPRGSEPLLAVLAATELSPLAAPTRLALLEALVESVRERNDKRRRVQINFVVEDIKRKLRRTHPDLSPRAVKDVLGALLRANQLMHKDGTPIRSPNASFTLTRTAEQLNRKLAELYLSELKKAGADLRNLSMLAELFFGDPDRRRDVETALAWVSAPTEEEDDLLVVDDVPTAAAPSLDDLLSVDEPAADAAEASEDRDDGRRRRRRRRGGRRDDAAGEGAESAEPHEPIDALDALLSVDGDEEPARPPRRGDSSDAPSRRGGSDAPPRGGSSDAPPRRGGSDAPSRRGSSDAPSRRGGSDAPSRRGSSDEPSRRGSSDEPSRRGGSDAPRRGGSVSRDGVATFSLDDLLVADAGPAALPDDLFVEEAPAALPDDLFVEEAPAALPDDLLVEEAPAALPDDLLVEEAPAAEELPPEPAAEEPPAKPKRSRARSSSAATTTAEGAEARPARSRRTKKATEPTEGE